MNLKIIALFLFVLIFTEVSYCQIPIEKIDNNKTSSANFSYEDLNKSDLIYKNQFILDSIIKDEKFFKFFKKNKNGSNTIVSSLIIFRIKEDKMILYKTRSNFKLNKLLNDFINKSLKIEDFKQFEKDKSYTLGIYLSYDTENSELFVELVELKKENYLLIYKDKTKVFNEPLVIKHQCKPIKEKNKN